jgi:hypothetical protein
MQTYKKLSFLLCGVFIADMLLFSLMSIPVPLCAGALLLWYSIEYDADPLCMIALIGLFTFEHFMMFASHAGIALWYVVPCVYGIGRIKNYFHYSLLMYVVGMIALLCADKVVCRLVVHSGDVFNILR